MISHLTLNYLSLVNSDEQKGAAALREMLSLYAEIADPATRKQVQGSSIDPLAAGAASAARVPVRSPSGAASSSPWSAMKQRSRAAACSLLAAVLERFFAKYVSINSFTETVLKTVQRGEIMRWPPTTGQRHLL